MRDKQTALQLKHVSLRQRKEEKENGGGERSYYYATRWVYGLVSCQDGYNGD